MKTVRFSLFVLVLAAVVCGAEAQVRPAAVFDDHMVLQAHAPVPVWGMADPEERITVTYGEVSRETVADADGRWRVELPAMDYVKQGRKLVLRGSTIVEFDDVLVGEVWLGIGQSNMEFPLDNCAAGKAIAKGGVLPRTVRYLHVPKDGSVTPRGMFDLPRDTRWRLYTAENEARNKRSSMLLALFGQRLAQELDVPVGLIGAAAGGANLETWMSAAAIAEAGTVKEAERLQKTCEGWRANDIRRWNERPANERNRLFPRLNFESRPTQCWNALAEPLAPFRVRGVLWYQGEMNSGWQLYLKQFPFFAKHLRAAFGDPDLPLYIVQLPDYKGDHWPFIRNVQRIMSETIGHSGLAVTIDGHEIDLHPRDKTKVVDRLARMALADCYGRKIVARSPAPFSAKLSGKSVVVTFDQVADGLKLSDGAAPRTFELAGTDKKFIPVKAALAGKNAVRLTVPADCAPRFVRYGWAPDPDVNLVNSADLPATPFELEIR